MKCEIIIVRYGLPELEQECVDSVTQHTTDVDYKLTVHDNYENDEGLSKVWNRLIENSEAEYICLLNNDTRVEESWLSKLLEVFDEEDSLGIIGPMTNSSTGPQGNLRNKTSYKRLLPTRYPLVGFCMVFPKSVWKEAGGFDEAFEIYGEDSDFCMTARELGYKWLIRTDVFIFHHGMSSTPIAIARGKDIYKLKKESKALFIKKWKTGKPTQAQANAQMEKKKEEQENRRNRAKIRREARERVKLKLETLPRRLILLNN